MKTIFRNGFILFVLALMAGCEDVTDMAVNRVVVPVALEVEETGAGEVTATFYELDKSGILNKDVGIDSIPVTGLAIEVFADAVPLGGFTTDDEGRIVISYADAKPDEYAGIYKGVSFLIKK